MTEIERHRTAIGRTSHSRPIRCALDDGLISPATTVLDYGCGRGDDVRLLLAGGVECIGWDRSHRTPAPATPRDVVNLGYVVNVIEDPDERAATLKAAWALSTKTLVVAARLNSEAKESRGIPFRDGWITAQGTFQKYFDQVELKNWASSVLGEPAVAAGPGVLYIFRDEQLRERFVSDRYRSRRPVFDLETALDLYQNHREQVAPLVQFMLERGRLPDEKEVEEHATVLTSTFGSFRRACRVVHAAIDESHWQAMAIRRGNDLLVYLALARFTKVPKLGTLPYFLQRDIKTFFGSYQAARNHANRLLFAAARLEAIQRACRNAAVGKLTPTALHVHRSALELLPPLLRVYEGCARALLGEVRDANIVKLNHREPKVTYLTYPAFDRDAHPALSSSISVNLRTFQVNVRDREYAANPPILHRKELFVPTGYPSREKFERLTAAEEKAGLLVDTTRIGRRMTFQNLLDQSGYALRGHILRKTPTF